MKRKGIRLIPYEPFRRKLLRNPDVKRHYDALGPEFAVIETMIRLRKAAKLSQITLAKRLGTKQSAVSRFESKGSNPTLLSLYKTARALGVELKISFKPTRRATR